MKHLKMMKKVALATTLVLGSTAAFAGENAEAEWGYGDDNGPEKWSNLHPEYATCGTGKHQSPVDLTRFTEAALPPIPFHYRPNSTEVLNNGHTIQVNFGEGNRIRLDGKEFRLQQFHFHAPSENTYRGSFFPMEAHLVHADEEGNLAVVTIMFRSGSENPVLKKIWAKMPEKAGEKVDLSALDERVNAGQLLPWNRDYFRFSGSLTTPPCSEGVRWLVLKNPVPASKEQIEQFQNVIDAPNNRPVQPLNARIILQ